MKAKLIITALALSELSLGSYAQQTASIIGPDGAAGAAAELQGQNRFAEGKPSLSPNKRS